MKGKICLCPASIAWIRKHLQKSARAGFNKMLRGLSPTSKEFGFRRKGQTSQQRRRRFSKKQLAAQRLFAKRAKAGTLRRRRRR